MNRLKDSTSPYLLQHADNPVHWWPWCDDALAESKRTGKPILLSIGYSACHWCHVMAHESFEDPETAELMNALFINIKVDREERPDLDKIYQTAHQLLSQRVGGWPLTVFLTPDEQVPFFAGTYFPREPRYGMVAFSDLLGRIDTAWKEQQEAIVEQNRSVMQAMSRFGSQPTAGTVKLEEHVFEAAYTALSKLYDRANGGFGSAPKFPHPSNLEFLMGAGSMLSESDNARAMALHTLRRMALGGVRDQLGGGFCRYSVDEYWMIPHFEKMLYDNGPLLALYTDAFQSTAEMLFLDTCETTAAWVMREMQSPEGGYYSSLDADSEGEEGKFYVWRRDELKAMLEAGEFAVVEKRYGFDREPNFEGKWHLHVYETLDTTATSLGLDTQTVTRLLNTAHARLMAAREKRIRPGRDEKVLTSWNALMIRGMARYGRRCNSGQAIDSADRALAFIRKHLWHEGRLLATYKDGKAHLLAYLDDYAFLIDAVLELLQARWSSTDLEFAIELADVLLEQFEDKEHGGFYFTAADHETLIQRPKSYSDDAMPSGNGIVVLVLLRLGYLLADERYLVAAEKTLRNAWSQIKQLPDAHCSLLLAMKELKDPTEILVMRAEEETLQTWKRTLDQDYAPSRLVLAIPEEAELPPMLAAKQMKAGGVIYPCKGTRCEPPVNNPAELPV